MALKGQGNNQLNVEPLMINRQNDKMLFMMNNIYEEKKNMDTYCQAFIESTDGDIKLPYQQLYDLIKRRYVFSDLNMRFKINENNLFIKEMQGSQK